MSGGFTVDPDILDEHAARLDGLFTALQEGSRQGRPVGLDTYGLLGRAFAAEAIMASRRVDGCVASLSAAAARLPEAVRATAKAYRRVDEAIAAGLQAQW